MRKVFRNKSIFLFDLVLILLEQHSTRKKRFQTIMHCKNPVQYCLNTPGTTLHR